MALFEQSVPIEQTTVEKVVQENWGFTVETCLKKSQNHTFKVKGAADKAYIVRVTPDPDNVEVARIHIELDFVAYLQKNGLSVCVSVPSKDKKLTVAQDNLVYCAFEYASGSPVVFNDFKWLHDEEMIKNVGVWIAQLHQLSQKYSAEHPDLKVRNWNELHKGVMKDAPIHQDDKATVTDPAKYGICHGDVNVSNFFYDEEKKSLCVFDWDQMNRGWFLYDLAQYIMAPAMCAGAGNPTDLGKTQVPNCDVAKFTETLIEGYETVAGKGFVDRDCLQRMLILRKLFYETFCRKAQGELPPDSPMGSFINFVVAWFDKEKEQN